MASLEVQGPTIQQAVQKALVRLQAARNQVRVKVLSEGQPGLFGMRGKKPAKIRVTLKTPLPGSSAAVKHTPDTSR